MKHIPVLIAMFCFAMMTTTAMAQPSKPLPNWEFGFATVCEIEDMASGFSPDVFPSVDKATFEKYATDGKIPSSMSTFLLKSPGIGVYGYVLIDAGLGTPGGALTANIGKAMYGGYQPEKITLVLLTHLHGDHIGGLLDGDARRFPNATVLCSKPEYEYWIKQNNPLVEKVRKAYGYDFRGELAFDAPFFLGGGEKLVLLTVEEHEKNNNVFQRGWVSVTPLNAVGHTPGHTAFLIESSDQKLMVIGDLLHAAAMQFPRPDVCARYDVDPAEAVKSRRRLLDMAAKENVPIAGMHIPNPGIGFVTKSADGYDFSPLKEKLSIDFHEGANDSVVVNYNTNGEYLHGQPADEALAWLETELKKGNCSIISVFDGDKRFYQARKGFIEEIVKLSEKYQVPYSMQMAISAFPGSPVEIHFPNKK